MFLAYPKAVLQYRIWFGWLYEESFTIYRPVHSVGSGSDTLQSQILQLLEGVGSGLPDPTLPELPKLGRRRRL